MVIIGSVRVDIYGKSRKYTSKSFSSPEDVKDILRTIDQTYLEMEKLNDGAITLYNDFLDLAKDCKYVMEYVYILIGEKPFIVDLKTGYSDFGKDITQVIAERYNVTKKECETEIDNEIISIVKKNKDKWLEQINIKYNNVIIKETIDIPNLYTLDRISDKFEPVVSNIDQSKLNELDYTQKYLKPKTIYKEIELPEDLQGLIDFHKLNKKYVKELNIKMLNASDFVKVNLQEQVKKINDINIEISKDISDMKRHYGIPIQKTNHKGKVKVTSYHNIDSLLTNKDDEVVDENDFFDIADEVIDDYMDEWRTEKVKEMAKEKLTDKQFIIFNLYYFVGLSQKDVSDVLGTEQRNITNDLKRIEEKLKKALLVTQ